MKKLAPGLSLLMLMCGCGGGGSVQPIPVSTISVSISPSSQTPIDQGQTVNYTATLQNDTTNAGVTWSVKGAGCTGSTCGTFTQATPTTATYNAPALVSNQTTVTITATSKADSSKSASATVVLNPPPNIVTVSLPSATPTNYYPAQNYSQTLHASGGAGTLAWSIASGSLPGGLLLNSAGLITGTPTSTSTTAATSNFTVKVTDQSQAAEGPVSAQQALSVTVVGVLTITTTTSNLPLGTLGSAYSVPIQSVGGTLPITWQLLKTASSLPVGLSLQGSSSSNSTFISGIPSQTGNYAIQVQAVDSSTPRQTSQIQSLTVTVNSTPLVVTSTSLPNAIVGLPYNAQLAASGGTPPYTWTETSAPSWLTPLAPSGAIVATPSAADLGTSPPFGVTVTDSTGATATATLTVTVDNPAAACTDSGNNGVLNGQYAFSLSGYTGPGKFLSLVGAFTADGKGNMAIVSSISTGAVSGEVDTNGVLGAQQGSLYATAVGQPSSSYSVGSNNLGCASFATTLGTFVTRFALAPPAPGIAATRGRIISWDAPNSSANLGTGVILQQNLTDIQNPNSFTGSYTFQESGWDTRPTGGRTACVGYLLASGSKFIVSGAEQDCNDAGQVSTPVGGGSPQPGTYSIIDPNGRGTAIVNVVSTGSGLLAVTQTLHLTFYMVSSSELLLVNSDPFPALAGEMVQQNVPTGGSGFSASSLSGPTVFYLTGGSNSGTGVSLNLADFDGVSNFNVASYQDYLGTWTGSPSPLSFSCPYSVGSNGRVSLNCAATGEYTSLTLYLTGLNTGFMIDTLGGVDDGELLPQPGFGSFADSSLSGTFTTGLAEVVTQSIGTLSAGLSTLNSGAVSLLRDETSTSSQTPDHSFTDTYTINADGTFTASSSTSPFVGVVVDTHTILMLDPVSISTPYPVLLLVQQ